MRFICKIYKTPASHHTLTIVRARAMEHLPLSGKTGPPKPCSCLRSLSGNLGLASTHIFISSPFVLMPFAYVFSSFSNSPSSPSTLFQLILQQLAKHSYLREAFSTYYKLGCIPITYFLGSLYFSIIALIYFSIKLNFQHIHNCI